MAIIFYSNFNTRYIYKLIVKKILNSTTILCSLDTVLMAINFLGVFQANLICTSW